MEMLERAVEVNAAVSGCTYRLAVTKDEPNVKGNDAGEFYC